MVRRVGDQGQDGNQMTITLNEHDLPRLEKQTERVAALMSDGQWRTLAQISKSTGDPESSVSARLRGLRQVGNRVERKRIGGSTKGLHCYRIASLGALSAAMADAAIPPEPIIHVERWI